MQQYTAPSDSQYTTRQYDSHFGHQIVVDAAHAWIHLGRHFFCTESRSLSTTNNYRWAVVVPSGGRRPHMLFTVVSQIAYDFYLYEGASSVTGGSALPIRNNNRMSSTTSGLTITSGVTTGADGTNLVTLNYGSPGPGGVGTLRGENELILAPYTYIVRVVAGGNGNLALNLNWYEPDYTTRADSGTAT